MADDETRPFPLNPNYRVYRDGRVESCLKPGRKGGPGDEWHPIKQRIEDGYWKFDAKIGQRHRTVSTHKAVLLAWVGPCPPGMLCRHLDGDKLNRHLDNLKWGTPLENTEDARRHGSLPSGERHWRSKFSDEEREVIVLAARKGCPLQWLADCYGVSYPALHYIVYGRKRRRAA